MNKNSNMLIKDDVIGQSGELGEMLMVGFLSNIKHSSSKPSSIFLVNRGVFLSTKNQKTIDIFKELEDIGIKIFSCGTCLDFFDLRSSLRVGSVGNAKDTLDALLSSQTLTL